jgi:hypothetical protein
MDGVARYFLQEGKIRFEVFLLFALLNGTSQAWKEAEPLKQETYLLDWTDHIPHAPYRLIVQLDNEI